MGSHRFGHLRRQAAALAVLAVAGPGQGEAPETIFDDPFVQATHGDQQCLQPVRPAVTRDDAVAEAHGRAERGVSCFLSGRCRLPNSYLYDKEIVPRAVQALNTDDAFKTTSVWVLGQRRWVWLMGCVATQEQRVRIEARIREIDDVEGVVNKLAVTPTGAAADQRHHGRHSDTDRRGAP